MEDQLAGKEGDVEEIKGGTAGYKRLSTMIPKA